MKIANIYTIKNQDMYKKEECVMILAHLLDKYDPKNFNENQFIIMDNGLYEGSQVSTDLEDLVQLAEHSKIPIKEIVIPDKMFNYDENMSLFRNSIATIKKWQHKYKFMVIAHVCIPSELRSFFEEIEKYRDLNLTVGIPKRNVYNRTSEYAIDLYRKCSFPIHFLGLCWSFEELFPAKKYLRSCDSCQLTSLAKDNITSDLVESKRISNVDLENDYVDEKLLDELKIKLDKELYYYGII